MKRLDALRAAIMPERQRIFVLGLGAQKAGTTWLHHYLSSRRDADFGFAKEYHVWDAVSSPAGAAFVEKTREQVTQLLAEGIESWRGTDAIRILGFMNDPETYFDYFARLLDAPHVNITGDLTPAHAALSADTLCAIRDGLERRGITVRPVFVVRDPVDRLQSVVRMHFRQQQHRPTLDEEIAQMRAGIGQRWEIARGDYARTIAAADSAFGNAVYYRVFEEFFTEQSIRALCHFLGIRYTKAPFGEEKNASSKENTLPDEVRREFAEAFRDRFAFCRDYFGAEKINTLWPSARLI